MSSALEGYRPIARVRSYDELMVVLRARAEQRHITREVMDADCKLSSGYAGKLLGQAKVRKLGEESFGAVLTYLGLEMVLVEAQPKVVEAQ